MMETTTLPFYYVVEGDPDEAILKRLSKEIGIGLGKCYFKGGKSEIKDRIRAYNNYARFMPLIVLIDLDKPKKSKPSENIKDSQNCAPILKSDWLPNPAQYMCFRIAVREIEAWLLADTNNISRFLYISVSLIPPKPEMLDDPKQVMVNLARKSRKRDIRDDMIPREGSGHEVGQLYNSRLVEFILNYWSPDEAVKKSDSLYRCISRLKELKAKMENKT
ncbi:MAG: hypothetical protein AAB116_21285 [Candidatus Poribacteria bacterium]